VKRTHTVSVRLSPEERVAWTVRCALSGRREMGAWVRAVVNDVLDVASGPAAASPVGGRSDHPGDVVRVSEINLETVRALARAGNNLNQLARVLHARDPGLGVARDVVEQIRVAAVETAAAARALRGRA